MALIDDLLNKELLSARPSMTCSVCILLNTLPQPEAEALSNALADPSVSKSAVARVLTANGHNIAPGTLHRHQRQECRSAKG